MKRVFGKWVIMVSAASTLHASPGKWIIHQEDRPRWEAMLRGAELSTEYVQRVLADNQVALEFGTPEITSEIHRIPDRETVREQLLWSDNEVSVFSARDPLVPHHTWVVLNREVASIAEVSSEEAVHLRGVVNKVLRVLNDVFELPHAVVAQWDRPQSGQIARRFTIEVLPPLREYRDVHHLPSKVDSNHHVHRLFPPLQPTPSAREVAAKHETWARALADPTIPPFQETGRGDPSEEWTQVQQHTKKAMLGRINFFHQMCVETGIRVERRDSPYQEEADAPIEKAIKGCSFCLPKVINDQRIYEGAFVNVLYNYKPGSVGSSFIFIPKRHLHCSDRLNEAEIAEMHQLAKTLVRALEEVTGRTEIDMYFQDGPEVGQTVKHTCMHLQIRPGKLRYLFFSMNYEKEKCYSPGEIRPVIQPIIDRFQALMR